MVNKKRKGKAGKNTQAWNMIAIIRGMYNWAIETPESFTTPFQFNPTIGVYSRNERKKFKPKARVRKWYEEELKAVLNLFPEKYSDLLTFILLAKKTRISGVFKHRCTRHHSGIGIWEKNQTVSSIPRSNVRSIVRFRENAPCSYLSLISIIS